MPIAGSLPDLQAHQRQEFARIKARHLEGAPSPLIVAALTDLVDEIVTNAATMVFGEEAPAAGMPWAIVALGGYGRRELNPYSDVDVMVLVEPDGREQIGPRSSQLFQLLWDLRYQLGHSLRTIDDCLELAKQELAAQTALMEARCLLGNPALFEQCRRRLAVSFRLKPFLRAKREEREREFEQYGATTALLEPNVKRSPGGLRDLHAVKWMGLALYQTADWQAMTTGGYLTAPEADLLQRHQAMLWQIRNDLHFQAGRSSDVLAFDEQQRLAGVFGYQGDHHLLPVEQFMQFYYRMTGEVHDLCNRVWERVAPRRRADRLVDRLLTRRVGHFLLTDRTIAVRSGSHQEVAATPPLVMELFALAHRRGVTLTDETRRIASSAVEQFPSGEWQTPEIGRRFLSMLGAPGRTGAIAATLRLMHQVRLLGRLLPAFAHATSLMQFNRYHHYTVDEHCIRAVGEAERMLAQDDRLGTAYRELKRKELLHLALLLHDVGKGYEGDHSERGVELAEEAAKWLDLSPDDLQLLSFLIRHHLLMSNIAFRRDLSDEKILLRFARQVAHPEALTMLYLLTAADIQAVGPGTWTSWKAELLRELFDRSMEILAGSRLISGEQERIQLARERAVAHARPLFDESWLQQQCDAMPARYWLTTPPEQVAEHLAGFKQLQPDDVVVTANPVPGRGTFNYTVFTYDAIIPGIFSKIAGSLAARGLQILSAQVYTRQDGTIVDSFEVLDPDYNGPPPPRRIAAVGTAIRDVLRGALTIQELFAKSRRVEAPSRRLVSHATQVEVDNDSSDEFTIIDIFADDRQGLLYVITNAIFEAGLSVHSAKIATRLDQIADVFYVKTREGGKLTDPESVARLKQRILDAVAEHLV